MSQQAPNDVCNRPWWRYGLIALGVILLVELPLVALALNSTIPYQWHWVGDAQGGTTILRYWDGRTEVTSHVQRPIWVSVLFYGLLVFAVAWTALWGVLGWRWFRRWRDRGYPWRFRFSLRALFWAAVLAGVCLTAVTLLDPEIPPMARVLSAGVLCWIVGCLYVVRRLCKRRQVAVGERGAAPRGLGRRP